MNKQPAQNDLVTLTHLQRLESESIHIMREVISENERPVMLYSAGKDSAVMLHLARKAFSPGRPALPAPARGHHAGSFAPCTKCATRSPRAAACRSSCIKIRTPRRGESTPSITAALHTDLWKTEGLKQALTPYGFDVAFGGARRDEEKSRAKERIFSFRSANHRWDPKNQRPELWNIYNSRKSKGESIRVFPLSNWTELDIWQYIHLENIAIVPLYFAAPRPTRRARWTAAHGR